MVYVVPNSLVITPSAPTTTQQLTASIWITRETLDQTFCETFPGNLWTKTNIYLYRQVSGNQWQTKNKIATINCTDNCCLSSPSAFILPGTFSTWAWELTFPIMNPITTPGDYDFIAVDQGDVNSFTSSRTATTTVTIARDPDDPCLTNPCLNQCDKKPCTTCPSQVGCTSGTTCAPTDYVCQIIDYVTKNPLIVVGGVVVLYLLLMPPRSRSRSRD